MKTLLLTLSILIATATTVFPATVDNKNDSLSALRREIVGFFDPHFVAFPDIPEQDVTIGFLINARNELILMEVDGDDKVACAFVQKVLGYKKVRFNQAKQLTMYSMKIHLVAVEG